MASRGKSSGELRILDSSALAGLGGLPILPRVPIVPINQFWDVWMIGAISGEWGAQITVVGVPRCHGCAIPPISPASCLKR